MPEYPAHWEADVVLNDGGTAHIRPIRPDDADRLAAMHGRLSPQTIYFRFFAPYPRLSARDLERMTTVDYDRRCALVAMLGGEIVAVVRYEALSSDEAEVAFVVDDAHQGRGIASVLLEHIAAAARERGLRRFAAEVLPSNRRMARVFLDAGYKPKQEFDEGVVRLEFEIAPTEKSLAVMQSREHRAEARSIERLLHPRSVAVVGAGRQRTSPGRVVFDHLLASGFEGPVYPVNPHASYVASVRAYPSLLEVPDEVDLAVVAVPAAAVDDVAAQAAQRGVYALGVVSAGFAESGADGLDRERRLVRTVRANGMRLVGPNSFGLVNTDPDLRLNASLAPTLPATGRAGMFSQSGALGAAILESAARRGLGLSTFVSAGNRADVSANDLLQFWEEDPATDLILLYLESFGNPRKFSRLARRIAARKPVVAVKTGRFRQRPAGSRESTGVEPLGVPEEAVDALLRQAGVIRVTTIAEMFDVAQLLAYQPLPAGAQVAVVGNSTPLGMLAADACTGADLVVTHGPVDLGPEATAEEFAKALGDALADEAVHAVVTVFVPPLATSNDEVARVIADAAATSSKPVLSTFLAFEGVPEQLRRLGPQGSTGPGSVPSYRSTENAVFALRRAVEYAEWRRRPRGRGPDLPDVDPAAARTVVDDALAAAPDGVRLSGDPLAALLRAYGIALWPTLTAGNEEEAVQAAARLGYPVALKAVADQLRHRVDLGGVRLDLHDEGDVRAAFAAMARAASGLVPQEAPGEQRCECLVQPMADPGVATVVGTLEDPSFGPLAWFGLAGVATDLLGDRGYRLVPLTDADAAELVRSVKAAPMLFGHRGVPPVDVPALEELLLRVARLADDHPEVAQLELNPVLVSPRGHAVLRAAARLAPAHPRDDVGPRRMG